MLKLLLANLEAQKAEILAIRDKLISVKEKNQKLYKQLDNIATLVFTQSSPRQLYIKVACTLPTSQLSNVQTLISLNSAPSRLTEILYYIIDTLRIKEGSNQVLPAVIRMVVESGVCGERENALQRYRAIIKDLSEVRSESQDKSRDDKFS